MACYRDSFTFYMMRSLKRKAEKEEVTNACDIFGKEVQRISTRTKYPEKVLPARPHAARQKLSSANGLKPIQMHEMFAAVNKVTDETQT
jgi:hypothetical protein